MPRRQQPSVAPALVEVARALADPSRAAMLDALLDGRAHAIGALARRARVAPATASSHLAALHAAGLVAVERAGRERRVCLASAEVAEVLERLAALATLATGSAPRAAGSLARGPMRFARTCYDHLAGVLGVAVAHGLVARGWLHDTGDSLEPAPALFGWLAAHGHPVAVGAAHRPLSRACLDGSERVAHVAGRIGAAVHAVFAARRWVAPIRDSRALRLTARGAQALPRELGVYLPLAR